MTTLAPPPAVTEYADAVRSHLAALDPETLDELTGGLEADLAEALAERVPDGGASDLASVTEIFGPAPDYAEELRVAAGVELPPTARTRRPRLRTLVAREYAGFVQDWQRWRTENRWFGALVDFLLALRPAWWLLRAWALFHLMTGLQNPFFGSGLDKVLLLGLVVVSVLWGQRRIGQRRWLRGIGLLASAIAVVAAAPVASTIYHAATYPAYASDGYGDGYDVGFADGQVAAAGQAAWLTGNPANLFVYGPDGQPVENAQVVDQLGNPVVLLDPASGESWASWEPWLWDGEGDVPAPLLDDDAPLNVYPMSYVGPEHLTWGPDGDLVGSSDDAVDPRWPAAALFPVVDQDAEPIDHASTPADDIDDPGPSATEEPTE